MTACNPIKRSLVAFVVRPVLAPNGSSASSTITSGKVVARCSRLIQSKQFARIALCEAPILPANDTDPENGRSSPTSPLAHPVLVATSKARISVMDQTSRSFGLVHASENIQEQ